MRRLPVVVAWWYVANLDLAFEGQAHPYKMNVLKVDKPRIVEMQEVKTTLQEVRQQS